MRTINCLLIDVSTAELQFSADVIPSLGYQMAYNRTIRKTRRRNAGEKREIFVSNKNKWEKRRKKKWGGGRWNYDLRRRHTHTHTRRTIESHRLYSNGRNSKRKKISLKHFSPVSQTIKRQWHKRWRKTLRLQCRAERLWEDGGSRGTAKLPKFLTRFLFFSPFRSSFLFFLCFFLPSLFIFIFFPLPSSYPSFKWTLSLPTNPADLNQSESGYWHWRK